MQTWKERGEKRRKSFMTVERAMIIESLMSEKNYKAREKKYHVKLLERSQTLRLSFSSFWFLLHLLRVLIQQVIQNGKFYIDTLHR